MFKENADYCMILADLQGVRQEIYANKDVSPFLRKYMEAQVFPKTAYCHYKLKAYAQAEYDLSRKFSVGYELFNEGCYFQFFDLLEQILNLGKVLLAQKRVDECVQNWSELFQFLMNGLPSSSCYLRFDYAHVNAGLFKILKEYSILNFLNMYINGYMKFGVYPRPSVLFSSWYHEMEVHTTERLAIYRYVSLEEKADQMPLQQLTREVVEFAQLFEQSNYHVLRCSLLALLVDKLEREDLLQQQTAARATLLRDHLLSFCAGIEWVKDLICRLERLILV